MFMFEFDEKEYREVIKEEARKWDEQSKKL